jgi:integrase
VARARRNDSQRMVRVAEGIYRRGEKYLVPIYDPETRTKRYQWPGVPRGGFDTLDEARRFKRRMEDEKRTRGSSRETCDAFAKRWPKDFPGKRGPSTIKHNAERVQKFAKDFEGVPISDVTRHMARQWALKNRGNLPAVRAMFSDAVRDGLISTNPFRKLGIHHSTGRANIVVLTEKELATLVRTAEQVWDEYGANVFGPMIVLGAYTGMRPGELYAMRWSWVDFETDEVHVRRAWQQKTEMEALPKNGRERTITLLPQARAALQRIPRRTDHDYVFYTQSGGPFRQRALHYYWDPVRKSFWGKIEDKDPERAQEIDSGFDFYELRHFYGTLLARPESQGGWGLSPYEIADQMGHSDGGKLAMERYIHPVSRDVRANIRDKMRRRQMLGPAADDSQAETG